MLGCAAGQEGSPGDARLPGGSVASRAPCPPVRPISVSEEQWLDWRQQQLDALSTAEEKAAAREVDAGASPRVLVRVPPSPRAGSVSAEAFAGTGTAPLAFEQRFVDRAALPKGVTFGAEIILTYRQH